MHCTKIAADFEFGGHSPWVPTPKDVPFTTLGNQRKLSS